MKHAPTQNKLALETSPYLLQHAENPVQWFPWGQEALQKAALEDKPILLSIGYSTCHWCHVMAHECFENVDIAALMNQHFVNIKVDREERPDLDSVYMSAVQAMTGSGGWPMTVFLTPQGLPFYGGTYFPPADQYGRPGFPRVLLALSEAWRERREDVLENAKSLTQAVQSFNQRSSATPSELSPEFPTRALQNLKARFDPAFGGFGDAPKFPAPTTLEFLLNHYHRTRNPDALEMVLQTLECMAKGGIYDQLGGGFSRYSTDDQWLVPHFEKMLYDNAQLLKVYLHSLQIMEQNDPRAQLFERTVRETFAYLEREMRAPSGGFYSAQDADSEGIEGKFFVWTPQELEALLGQDAELVGQYFGVTLEGNFLDPHQREFGKRTVLSQLKTVQELAQLFDLETREVEVRLERSKKRMWQAREQRIHPHTDDKILTSWNGLALSAFALGARVLQDPHLLELALHNAEFAWDNLREPNGGLWHTHKVDGKAGISKISGLLEDLVLYGLGLLELYQACGDLKWLTWARDLWHVALPDHWDAQEAVFFSTSSQSEALIVRPQEFFDAAILSDNAAALLLGLWMDRYFGDAQALEITQTVLSQRFEEMLRAASGFGGLWQVCEFLLSSHTEIAVLGTPQQRQPLERIIAQHYLPFCAIAPALEPSSVLPLLEGRGGAGLAYVCKNQTCDLPTGDLERLEGQILGL
jgi:uncharacterized protein